MSENVEAFRSVVEAVNRRDLDAHSTLMAADVEIIPMRAALESETAYRGPDASAQWLAAIEQSWERLTADLEDFRETGDCVLALGRIRARGRESGIDIDVPAAALARFQAGQVIYLRVYTDQAAALEAAGLSEQATSEENVEIVRRMSAAFNRGGIEAAAEFFSPDVVFEEPPTQPGSKTARGAEDARETFSAFDDAWIEHHSEIEEIRALSEDDVLTLTIEHLRGRDGIAFAQPCGAIITVRNGKVVRLRPFWDRSDALEAARLSQ